MTVATEEAAALLAPIDLSLMQSELDALRGELAGLREAGVSPYEIARLHRRLAAAQAELHALRASGMNDGRSGSPDVWSVHLAPEDARATADAANGGQVFSAR